MALTEIDGSALGPTAQRILGRRNLVVNGAMNIAQRATTSTATGYQTVDRFAIQYGGADENPTQAQVDITADTDPWNKGFRKALKITNGDQASGAGAADYVEIQLKLEAQDIANSGWEYTSTSDYITLSFWVKSSVAQTFYGYIDTIDGTGQRYSFSFALSANTWTKVIKTIPGAANITVNNDNGQGLLISFVPFYGTDYTNNNTLDTWAEKVTGNYFPDQTSTWWTTDNATFEITGVQVEVANSETEFEHRSYGDELLRCQRYYYCVAKGDSQSLGLGIMSRTIEMYTTVYFPVVMRATPTLSVATGTDFYKILRDNANDAFTDFELGSATTNLIGELLNDDEVSGALGDGGFVRTNNASSHVGFSAEL